MTAQLSLPSSSSARPGPNAEEGEGQTAACSDQDGRQMSISWDLGPTAHPTETICFPGAQRHLGFLGQAAWEERQHGTFPQRQQARWQYMQTVAP